VARFDYTGLVADAQALIFEFGRSVSFIKFDTTPADAAQPWLGAAAPRTVPDATLAVNAVFVEPDSTRALGLSHTDNDMVKRSEQIMILSPGASDDLDTYQEVIDSDGTRWKVVGVQVLKPAEVVVLAFVGVMR